MVGIITCLCVPSGRVSGNNYESVHNRILILAKLYPLVGGQYEYNAFLHRTQMSGIYYEDISTFHNAFINNE